MFEVLRFSIQVVYGSVSAPPEDRVLEVNGLDCNISYTYTDPYTYVTPNTVSKHSFLNTSQ